MKLSQFNRILLQTLFVPVFALLCVSGVLVWQILKAERTVAHLEIADQNIASINLISALIADQETGVRGYQSTSNPIFLQPYEASATPLQQSVQKLRAGVASQNGGMDSVDALQRAQRSWLHQIAIPMIATVTYGGNARDPAVDLRGKAYMDHIREIEARIFISQEAQRKRLIDHWHTEVLDTLAAVVGLGLVIGLMIGVFARNRLGMVRDAYRATMDDQRRTQAALLASEKLAVGGRLAASIAHEIHNPLDSVVNLLYLMKQGSNEPERQEFIDIAQAELKRVTRISRAMLSLYRESQLPVALNISDILQDILVLLDYEIAQAGLSVEFELAPNAVAQGFPAEIREVFLNLLTNAAEASHSGGTIEVRASSCSSAPEPAANSDIPSAESGVVVTITDHGRGIAPRNRELLFRPFFTTKDEPGSGLGLWVSQAIVHKHGGSIKVKTSTEATAHGTAVTVFLPCGETPLSISAAVAASV